MGANHYKYLKVKNFKRFDNLEVSDIGQFNLILGDNNVGKTSLLEALLWNEQPQLFEGNLFEALKFRNVGEVDQFKVFQWYVNNNSIYDNKASLQFIIRRDEDGERSFEYELDFRFNSLLQKLTVAQADSVEVGHALGNFSSRPIPFIPFSYGYSDDLVNLYSLKVQPDREVKRDLISALRALHPELDDIEISISELTKKPGLICYFDKSSKPVPFPLLGEGVIKLFRVLVEIINNSGEIILIDELDTGIHYSRMTDYWKVILQAALEYEVQVFASTHNRECVESFQLAVQDLGQVYQAKSRTVTLKQSPKTGNVKAYTAGFGVLKSAVELGNELR
ncbi:AAA family ATPase [Marinoscillum furvescens]|uniref:AAA15 family ATPase/GTPase n=1 Tax=Marinoscillum furvescens DSM 4134 TaxID=1122208 RepID=A0A3D9L3N4_MARFU|nr:ATP-binding protein [Marinoscillum furvescens]RED99894.1 AAA15 family ATPase/GTPase [Marinoscillum furvescens DSM 4134]